MDNYLSAQNKAYVYNFVKGDIYSKTNYNIDDDNKYLVLFDKLMTGIAKSDIKFSNVQHYNNVVVSKSVPAFITSINKAKTSNSNILRGNEVGRKNMINDRPIVSNYRNVQPANPSKLRIASKPLPYVSDNQSSNQLDKKTNMDVKYSHNQINELLSGLSVSANSKPNHNHNDIPAPINTQGDGKINFDDFVKSRDSFTNEVNKSELSQQMLLKQINQQKQQNNKDFYAAMKPTVEERKDLQFDPKDMYKDLMKTGKQVEAPIKDFKLNPPDLSEVNQIKERDPEVEKMLNNDWLQKDIKESTQKSIGELYQNPGYVTERFTRKLIVIDTGLPTDPNSLGGNIKSNLNSSADDIRVRSTTGNYWDEFVVDFLEPITIDKRSEVFLESLIIKNAQVADTTPYFIMEIDAFNIKSISNNPKMNNKFVIPNENTTSGGEAIMKYNLKSNYVALINPTKLSSLKIKITDQDGLNDATNDTKVFVGNIDNAAANKNQLNRIIIEFAITAVKD